MFNLLEIVEQLQCHFQSFDCAQCKRTLSLCKSGERGIII